MKTVDAGRLTGQPWWGRLPVGRTISDLMQKRWTEAAVPLLLGAALTVAIFVMTDVGLGDSESVLNETAVKGFLAIGLTIVLVAGGIDLSIGSIMGVAALVALILDRAYGMPVIVVALAAPLTGAVLGAVNGFFVAFVKTRPFITTLITLTVFRGLATALESRYALDLAMPGTSALWDFLGKGTVMGLPTLWFFFLLLLILTQTALTRSRYGWHVLSVGSDPRAARRNGIRNDRITASTYVLSGAFAGVAGMFDTARLGRADAGIGVGAELVVLTAVVIGGVSLTGGRGSVMRAALGMFVIAILQQATIVMQMESGYFTTLLAVALLVFAVLDIKWGIYRARLAQKLSLDPGRLAVGPLTDVTKPGTVWSLNRELTDAPAIGVGIIEGAEDCALDNEGNMYCGDRRGWVWKFSGETYERGEVFARTGGLPLGHAWDSDGSLLVAVGGIGVQRIQMDGTVELVANRVRRSLALHDDSAIRFSDDLDVAPDGSIYVSDFSTRTSPAEYMLEFIECRPNGRVIRIDPDGSTDVVVRNYVFPNGICTAHDGQSILIASTGLFRVDRLWISGPKQGQIEPVMENLPGYPDNINRASDGNYWMSFVAMRTPASDALLDHPSARRRMTKELPVDDWLAPQLNVSCVVKFSEQGEVLRSLWDASLQNYPMVTSMNEFRGELFLGGVHNNRIGRFTLGADEVGPIDPRVVPGTPGAVATPRREVSA